MQSIIMQTYIVMFSIYWLQQHMIYTILYIYVIHISAIQEVLSSTLKLKYLNLLHEEPFQPFQSESSRSIESHISSTHMHTHNATHSHTHTVGMQKQLPHRIKISWPKKTKAIVVVRKPPVNRSKTRWCDGTTTTTTQQQQQLQQVPIQDSFELRFAKGGGEGREEEPGSVDCV